jgi:hypothetical protein
MEDAARGIRLELRFDGESPTGRASTPDDGERGFAGWLGLIAAIEALAGGDRETGAGQGAHRGGIEEDTHDGTNR